MDIKPSKHPTFDILQAYSLGKLDDASAGAVMKHLVDCQDCRRQVAEMSPDSFLDRLRDAQAGPETPSTGRADTGGTQTDQGGSIDQPTTAPEPCAASSGVASQTSIGAPPGPSGPQPETLAADDPTLGPPSPGSSPIVTDDTQPVAPDNLTGSGPQPGTFIRYFGD